MGDFFFMVPGGGRDDSVAHGGADLDLTDEDPIEGWDPPSFRIAGRATDYLANDAGVRLLSEKLKGVIERHRDASDVVEWLTTPVVDEEGVEHPYAILRFPVHPDVLDPDRTVRTDDDVIIKAVVSLRSAGSHQIFSFPEGSPTVFVTRCLRKAIKEAGCQGVDFENAPQAPSCLFDRADAVTRCWCGA